MHEALKQRRILECERAQRFHNLRRRKHLLKATSLFCRAESRPDSAAATRRQCCVSQRLTPQQLSSTSPACKLRSLALAQMPGPVLHSNSRAASSWAHPSTQPVPSARHPRYQRCMRVRMRTDEAQMDDYTEMQKINKRGSTAWEMVFDLRERETEWSEGNQVCSCITN
jgi:hypothetical protein